MDGGGQYDPGNNTSHLHSIMIDLLPEYVAVALEGGDPAVSFPHLAAHLATCSSCADDLAELMRLSMAAYSDQDAPPPAYPTPVLSSLSRADAPAPRWRWRIDDLGRLLLEISDYLLAMARPSPLVGLARADDLLYDLAIPSEDIDDPALRIEIFDQDHAVSTVRVRVSVELPGQDAFDAAGTEVALLPADEWPGEWRALTDAVGTVSFSGVPRQALPGLCVAVTADQSA